MTRGVLPDRLEQPVAVLTRLVDPMADQALVEERLESHRGRLLRPPRRAASVQPAREYRETPEDALLLVLEQIVRPGDRRLERPLPFFNVAVAEASRPRRSPRRSRIASVERERTRAAASSIASGSSSTASQIAATCSSELEAWLAAEARSRKRRVRRRQSPSGAPRRYARPEAPGARGWTRRPRAFGQAPMSAPTSAATASTRCSQLSTTRAAASRNVATTESEIDDPGSLAYLKRLGKRRRDSVSSRSGASGIQYTPSGNPSDASAAAWSASRVFPVPPGPVSVTSRASCG